jgi:hypothetical protein
MQLPLIANGGPVLKHTLHVGDILSRLDGSRAIFPRGVLSKVRKGADVFPTVKRIEFFANKAGGETYGVIRSFHVAFSSEPSLLELAEASTSVIHVRSFETREAVHGSPGGKTGLQGRTIVEDKLVLKRSSQTPDENAGDDEEDDGRPITNAIGVRGDVQYRQQQQRRRRREAGNRLLGYHSLPIFRPATPDIVVPRIWLQKMNLSDGDRLMVSNPIEQFAVPPPQIASGTD